MVAKNEHTGDKLQTKPPTKAYSEGWERIFGKKGCKAEKCFCTGACKGLEKGKEYSKDKK